MARKPKAPLFPTPRTVQPARPAPKPAPAPRAPRKKAASTRKGLFPGRRVNPDSPVENMRQYAFRRDETDAPDYTRWEKFHDMPDGRTFYGSGFTGEKRESDLSGQAFYTYQDAWSVAMEEIGEVGSNPWMQRAWAVMEVWQDDRGLWHVYIEYNEPFVGEYSP